jgi:hypothetical protein
VVPEKKENLPVEPARRCQLRPARQPARPASDLARRALPGLRQAGEARNRHDGHLRRFVVVFRALHRAPRRNAHGPRRGRLLDERRPVYRRHRARDPAPALFPLLRAGDAHLRPPAREAKEPFDALFTQGMVTHEIYMTRDAKRTARLSPARGRDRADRGRQTAPAPRLLVKEDASHGATGQGPVEVIPSAKMSKSKKNVVDPVNIIEAYGADTARWFVLSDSPPERDVEWTASGAEAAYKHLARVWSPPRHRGRGWRRVGARRGRGPGARHAQDDPRRDDGHRELRLQRGHRAALRLHQHASRGPRPGPTRNARR